MRRGTKDMSCLDWPKILLITFINLFSEYEDTNLGCDSLFILY